MRTIILLIITIALLAGGFAFYLSIQSPPPRNQTDGLPDVAPPLNTAVNPDSPIMGAGEQMNARSYDRATGRLLLEFGSERYEPQRDGTWDVTRPSVRFHLSDGNVLRMTANTGRVVMSTAATERQIASGQGGMPSRGEMRDVTIDLFDQPDARTPRLTCRVPILSFDNDTYRIATEAAVIDGKLVSADRIPVRVRGEDVEFDGYGLVLRWNGLDGRLDSLEITHGERLTIRNPSRVLPQSDRAASLRSIPAMYAQADGRLAPTQPPATTDTPRIAYRAQFDQDVVVLEGESQVASADQLLVDLLSEATIESASPTPPESAGDAIAPPSNRRRERTTRPVDADAADPDVIDPAPQDSAPLPVTVRWTGKLRVAPLAPDQPAPPTADDYIVQLVGSPVSLARDGAEAICGRLVYRTADESIALEPSADAPVVELTDADGVSLRTTRVLVDRSRGIATLEGNGRAKFPVRGDDGRTDLLTADWRDGCVVGLSDDGRVVQSATLNGAVSILHPRVNLAADQLDLAFDPPAAKPAADQPADANRKPADRGGAGVLRQLRATGSVSGNILDDEARPAAIATRVLVLDIGTDPAGRSFVQQLAADGDVKMSDARQSLAADSVLAEFAPRTAAPADATPRAERANRPDDLPLAGGSTELSRLRAAGNVRWKSATDARTAEGAEMIIIGPQDATRLTLIGAPARIVDGESFLVGPVVTFEPATDIARVDGEGRLRAFQPAEGDAAPRQIDVAWKDGIDVDGPNDRATVRGGVVATTPAADGAIQSARGQTVALLLSPRQPAPVAGNAANPNLNPAPPAPATRQTVSTPFEGREVRQVVFDGEVDLGSQLTDAAGAMLRRMHLLSPRATFDVARRILTVPVAGRMLYEDRRPAPADAARADDPFADMRGTTAFQWKSQLVYSESERLARLEGGVTIVHQRADEAPIRLNAETVTAQFEDAPADPAPADPAAAGKPREQSLSLKRIIAEQQVEVTAPQARFRAAKIEYNPATGQMVATGSPDAPGELFDEQGVSQGTFESLTYNTRTRQIDSLKRPTGRIRR